MRSSKPLEEKTIKHMKKFCEIITKNCSSETAFYVHESIPGDLAMVIISQTQEDKFMETRLGNYMTEVLKQFGLVDYNCWLQIEDKQHSEVYEK
jgi:hypothetical protein